MNDQKIYALMFVTPNIRAAEIADALAAPLADVSEALRDLVTAGDVVRITGLGPDGRQAMIYNLSDEFKASRKYAALRESAAPGSAPTAAPTPVSTPGPAVPAAPFPTVAPSAPPASAPPPADEAGQGESRRVSPMMRTERAMAFLRERGDQGARSTELVEAMGLRSDQSPSNFLRTARERGQIKNTDGRWYCIEGVQAEAAPPTRQAVPAGPFRCGVWLDDVIELQRGGITLDKLNRSEAMTLRDFLNRVLPVGAVA
jgi:hypothetical protein